MDIADAIHKYDFHGLEVGGYKHSAEELKEYLKTDWTTTIDRFYGTCFTFDPSKLNSTLVPVSKTVNYENKLAYFEVTLNYANLAYWSPISYRIQVHDSIHDRFDAEKVTFTLFDIFHFAFLKSDVKTFFARNSLWKLN